MKRQYKYIRKGSEVHPERVEKNILSPLSENHLMPHSFRPLQLGVVFHTPPLVSIGFNQAKHTFSSLCHFNSLVVSIEFFSNLFFLSLNSILSLSFLIPLKLIILLFSVVDGLSLLFLPLIVCGWKGVSEECALVVY